MQHYNHNSYEQSHPLQANYDPSSATYPSQQQHNNSQHQQQELGYQRDDQDYNQHYDYSNSNGNNQLSNLHQASPIQLDQLQAQRQYNQQQQHYNDADETLKQQHRVARTSDKSVNHLYPPQPNGSSSSIDMQDGSSLKNSFSTLFKFPCSTNGKALMLVIGLEALLVIIIQTIIVVKYFDALRDTPIEPRIGQKMMPPYLDSGNASRAIPAYLIVFVFAQLFQLVLAWDAVSLGCLSICFHDPLPHFHFSLPFFLFDTFGLLLDWQ